MKTATMLECLLTIVVTLISATVANVRAGPYSFTPLGFPPGQTLPPGPFQTNALGISADGSAVVGFFDHTDPYEHAFRWTSSGGMRYLTGLEQGNSIARNVSGDGSVVVGHSGVFENRAAFRWTEVDGPLGLGDLSDGRPTREANGVSDDGAVVVGNAYSGGLAVNTEAFRWTQGNGSIPLGHLPTYSSSNAFGLSADGSVVVGYASATDPGGNRTEAFRWTQADGMVGLGDLPGGPLFSQAIDASADGSVIVGWAESEAGREAFRWTQTGGMVGLGDLPGNGFRSAATAVSADGSVVVGIANFSSEASSAYLWTKSTGMVSMQELLSRGGASGLNGWSLLRAWGISADGHTIAGLGINPDGVREPWIATVPDLEPTTNTWNLNSNGNWSLTANWIGGVPNAVGAQTSFGGIITAPRTVTVDVPITLGRIEIDNASAYTIAGTNTLTLDATSGDAQINVTTGSHTISAPVTLADNTTFTVTPAASNLSITGALNATGRNLTKAGAGTLTINNVRAAGLSINSGTVAIAPNAGASELSTSVLATLSIAGDATPTAKLDLNNSAAIINYTGTSPVITARQQILAGRGGPGLGKTWNGPGITSSAAATANATDPESRSVGYAENAALPLGPYTTFRGQSVDDTSLLLAYTRTGDANLDGLVNDDDVTIVGATYAPGVPQPHWALGDFDYNGFIDDDDVTLLGVFYDPSAPPLVTSEIEAATTIPPIPELSTWAIAACGLLCVALLWQKRRRVLRPPASGR